MNLFGHYIPRRVLLLTALDGAVFFFLPLALTMLHRGCGRCGAVAELALDPLQALTVAAALLLLTVALGLYNTDAAHDLRTFCRRFLLSWEFIAAAAVGSLALSGAAAGASFGLSLALLALGVGAVMTFQFGLHLALEWWLSRPAMKRRILVIGDTAAVDEIGVFLRGSAGHAFEHVDSLPNWGRPDAQRLIRGNLLVASAPAASAPLPQLAEQLRCNEIVVAAHDRAAVPAHELLECKLRGVEVTDALDFWEREAGLIDVAKTEAAHMAFSTGFILGSRRRLAKRLADILISGTFFVLAAPLCLLVALAIRLESPGPVFYRQERVGLNGAVFKVWKFRSMRPDAEVDGAPRWASAADDRVTRIGRFIRKVRIDEIPQVLNVLAGDMSFIGPRPERPFFVDQLRQQIPHYDLRHRVPPGITGWAQVNYPYGASIEDAKRKLAYDLYYVKRYDVLLDLLILLQTIRVVLFAQGGR